MLITFADHVDVDTKSTRQAEGPAAQFWRGGEGTFDWDAAASNCSTGNCLFDSNKRISSKSSNWYTFIKKKKRWNRKARIEKFEARWGFPTVSSRLPSSTSSTGWPPLARGIYLSASLLRSLSLLSCLAAASIMCLLTGGTYIIVCFIILAVSNIHTGRIYSALIICDTILYNIMLYYVILHYIVSYHITLYNIISHYTMLYYIILYQI